ncbi:hypothetical protein [Sinobaca sp. H24]|uniref:hypothetical protein n=1 Tax=Sinobaca sp. H24 TaxID=2923376 RepID=UPI0020793153|nr:hypothetical protein [Sinobaca sp. H24]
MVSTEKQKPTHPDRLKKTNKVLYMGGYTEERKETTRELMEKYFFKKGKRM